MPRLPEFVDQRFPGPEPRVSAFLLPGAIDIPRLRARFEKLGCPTRLWQGQVLLCGSGPSLGQQRCFAMFLQEGSAVCWHMNRATEAEVLEMATSAPSSRRKPGQLPIPKDPSAPPDSPYLMMEELDTVEAPAGSETRLDAHENCVRLARDPDEANAHLLGISLGLAVAVRLEALEVHIESRLEKYWDDMNSKMDRPLMNLSKVTDRIFVAERGLHELRYALNSEAGQLDHADLLDDHPLAERLYDQTVAYFDVLRRTRSLNERLSYSLEHLHTLGEHVRHRHSARLERMIILIIFLELCLGLVAHLKDRH